MTFKEDGDYFGSYYNPNIRRRELMRHSMRDADAVVRFDVEQTDRVEPNPGADVLI